MDMIYRCLGRSGLPVSALSFGSWVTFGTQMDLGEAATCMRRAYDAGVNFFDNAEAYAAGESERLMGEALKKEGWSRDTFIVSSKVFWGRDLPTQKGLHRKHVREACDAALRRLQVDYLDLFFCHRPDLDTPVEETVRAMHDLVTQGKVLYWGTSEWTAAEISEAYDFAHANHLTPPTMEQPQYNLLVRSNAVSGNEAWLVVRYEYAPVFDDVEAVAVGGQQLFQFLLQCLPLAECRRGCGALLLQFAEVVQEVTLHGLAAERLVKVLAVNVEEQFADGLELIPGDGRQAFVQRPHRLPQVLLRSGLALFHLQLQSGNLAAELPTGVLLRPRCRRGQQAAEAEHDDESGALRQS